MKRNPIPLSHAPGTSSPSFHPVRVLSCFAFSFAALLVLPRSVRAGTNLLTNPGFEDGTTSWGVFIPPDSEGKGCELVASKEAPHSGTGCAEMKSVDFARFAIYPKSVAAMILSSPATAHA